MNWVNGASNYKKLKGNWYHDDFGLIAERIKIIQGSINKSIGFLVMKYFSWSLLYFGFVSG